MTSARRRSRAGAIALLVLLMLPSVPTNALHQARVVEDAPRIDTVDDGDVETGYMALDDQWSALQARQQEAVDGLNHELAAVWGTLQDPPVVAPVPLLDDAFAPGERHGGLGEWSPLGEGGGWGLLELDDARWVRNFGDADDKTYPSATEAILLSPIINLATLEQLRRAVPLERGDALDQTDLYTLFLEHRFAFAADPAVGGLDGARVEVFQMPLRKGDEGEPIRPLEAANYTGTVAFDDDEAFTGSRDWKVDAFDLTPWAGLKVRLGFHVRTIDLADPGVFEDRELFPSSVPPGWQLGHVEVRAPGLPVYTVIDRAFAPAVSRFEAGIPEPAPGPITFEAPVWNLGTRDAPAEIKWIVRRHGERAALGEGRSSITLGRGDVHVLRATVNVPPIDDPIKQIVWFNATARTTEDEAQVQRAFRAARDDPGQSVTPVRVHMYDDLRTTFQVSPVIAEAGAVRRAWVELHNLGNSEKAVHLIVEAASRGGPREPDWILGHRHRNVTVEPGASARVAYDVLIPDEGDAILSANLTWTHGSKVLHIEHTKGVYVGTPRPLLLSTDMAANSSCGFANFTCESPGTLLGSLDERHWRAPGPNRAMQGRPVGCANTITSDPASVLASVLEPSPTTDCSELVAAAVNRQFREAAPGAGGAPGVYGAPLTGYRDLALSLRYAAPPGGLQILVRVVPIGPKSFQGQTEFLNALNPPLSLMEKTPRPISMLLPPDDGLMDGALAHELRRSWRDIDIDLSEIIARETGIRDVWDVAIQELVVRSVVGDVLLDHLRLSGVPVDRPHIGRTLLLQTGGALAEDIGIWTIDGWQEGVTAPSSADATWQFSKDRKGLYHASGQKSLAGPGFARLYSPSIRLDARDPVLVLHHEYETDPSTIVEAEGLHEWDLREAYTVFVQFRQENGRWSPLHWIQPGGGYPSPFYDAGEGRADVSDIDPGDGFYHPRGEVPLRHPGTNHVLALVANGSGPRQDHFDLSSGALGGLNLTGREVRFVFAILRSDPIPAVDKGFGWTLRGLRIHDRPLSHDVSISNVRLNPPYDFERIGAVGPGTVVPIQVEVNNTGFYPAERVDVSVAAYEGTAGIITTMTTGTSLAPQTGQVITFLYQVPTDAGVNTVTFEAVASLRGAHDQDGLNDNRTLGPVPVRAVADLQIRMDHDPRTAPVGVTRTTALWLRNVGNIPLDGIEVSRTIERVTGAVVREREDQWTIRASIPPGTPWLRLDDPSLDSIRTARPPESSATAWSPQVAGLYIVAARASSPNETLGLETNNFVEAQDDALETLFADDFEQTGAGAPADSRSGGDAALWNTREGAGRRASTALWVGGTADGYPNGVDGSVQLPRLDLTTARAATLSFLAQYDTEDGYDGAVIEGSTDGGRTWQELIPMGASVLKDRPSVPGVAGWEGRPSGAMTGTSSQADGVDGWSRVAVSLGQIHGFTVPATLADLTPLKPPTIGEGYRSMGSAFRQPSWLPGSGSPLGGFFVLNGTVDSLKPPWGGRTWYSGTQGGALNLTVDNVLAYPLQSVGAPRQGVGHGTWVRRLPDGHGFGDADLNLGVSLSPFEEICYVDRDADGIYKAGDDVYASVGTCNAVSEGDLRFSVGPYGGVGTRVDSGDGDLGAAEESFLRPPTFEYADLDSNGRYDAGDLIFVTLGAGDRESKAVLPGDLRVAGPLAGQAVRDTDTDVGRNLLTASGVGLDLPAVEGIHYIDWNGDGTWSVGDRAYYDWDHAGSDQHGHPIRHGDVRWGPSSGEDLVAHFWDWRSGTTNGDREGSGGWFLVEGMTPGGQLVHVEVSPIQQPSGAPVAWGEWTRRMATIHAADLPPGAPLSLRFHYRSDPDPNDPGNSVTHCPGVADENGGCLVQSTYEISENLRHLPGPVRNLGWGVSRLRVNASDPLTGRTHLFLEEVSIDDPLWHTTRATKPGVANIPWTKLTSLGEWDARNPPHFRATAAGTWTSSQGEHGLEWHLEPVGNNGALAPNLDARLVSPPIDLRLAIANRATMVIDHRWSFPDDPYIVEGTGVGGGQVCGQISRRCNIPRVSGGAVEIQVFNETTGSFGPWRVLFPSILDLSNVVLTRPGEGETEFWKGQARYDLGEAMGSDHAAKLLPYNVGTQGLGHTIPDEVISRWYRVPPGPPDKCEICRENPFDLVDVARNGPAAISFLFTGSREWNNDTFDLSPYLGKRVRIALHATGVPRSPASGAPEFWEVRAWRVETEIMRGGSMDLRFRFLSDSTVTGHGLGVDDILVGSAPFERSLAIAVDREMVVPSIPPGRSFWVNGTIENRGVAPRAGFGVRLFHQDDPNWLEVGAYDGDVFREGPAGPFALGPGGEETATDRFAFRVAVAKNAPEGPLPLVVRLVERAVVGAPPLFDEVAAGKRIDLTVNVTREPRIEASILASPLRAEAGFPVNLSAQVRNMGPWALHPVVWTNVTRGRQLVHSDSERLSLAPGESTLVPDGGFELHDLPPGNYLVDLHVRNGTTAVTERSPFFVGRTFTALGNGAETKAGFDTLETGVVSTVETCRVPPMLGTTGNPPSKAGNQWSVTSATSHGGTRSFLFGALPGKGTYDDLSDSKLETPIIDVSGISRPVFSFFHQPHFGPGDGAVVEMRFVDATTGNPLSTLLGDDNCRRYETHQPNARGWFLLEPDDGYDHATTSTEARVDARSGQVQEPGHYNALGDGHPVLGGNQNHWSRVRVALDEQVLHTPQGTPLDPSLLREAAVQFRLRATTQYLERQGSGWLVDDLAVTGHDVVIEPPANLLPISNGARKEYAFTIHNPSLYDDSYDVSVDWNATNIPRDLVELLTSEVRVPAGRTALAHAAVKFPVTGDTPSGTFALVLEAASRAEPLVGDTARLELGLKATPHADLVGKLQTGGTRFEIDSTATIGAVIVNAGDATSPSTTARFAVSRPDGSDRRVLREVRVPPISAPGELGSPQAVVATNWTVPVDLLGPLVVHLEVDPTDQVVELRETNNDDSKAVEVVPLQRPDLELLPTDIEVLDLSGQAVANPDAFQLLRVIGTVRNIGNQPAPNVRVNFFLGPSLVHQASAGTIQPGEERRVTATLFAPGTTTRLSLATRTSAPELREDNNEAAKSLLVAATALAVTARPERSTLADPEAPAVVEATLTNLGTLPRLVQVRGPEGPIGVTSEPPLVALAAGASQTIRLTFQASLETPEGDHEVPLAFEDPDGKGRLLSSYVVTVPQRASHEIATIPVAAAPGAIAIPVVVRNTGNVRNEWTVNARAPGWETVGTSRFVLDPGEETTERVLLRAPNATAPGRYDVTLEVLGRVGDREEVPAVVSILPTPRIRIHTTPAQEGGTRVEHAVELVNTGNVPVSTLIAPLAQPQGWRATLDVPVTSLAPGDTATGRLVLEPTGEPAPGIVQFPLSADLVSRDAGVGSAGASTLLATVDVRPAQLVVADVEQVPRFGVGQGDTVQYTAQVENRGSGPASPVDVWLFVNDELVDHVTVERIEGHSVEMVELAYSAKKGSQTVTLVVDPDDVVNEPVEDDNAAAWVLDVEGPALGGLLGVPAPALPLVVTLIALAGAACRRRRP